MPRNRPSPGRYLEWHGNSLRVVVRVPRHLSAALGRTTLKESLNTDSVKSAETLKWDVIARLKRQINGAAGDAATVPVPVPLNPRAQRFKEALRYRQARRSISSQEDADAFDADLDARVEELAEREGEDTAVEFYGIASDSVTPLEPLLAPWFKEVDIAPRTEARWRLAVNRFLGWCAANQRPATAEGVTRKTAGDYVSSVLSSRVPTTANQDITGLSAFWVWLEKRGHASGENPWRGQRFANRRGPRTGGTDSRPRPFTDAEAAKLLKGITRQPMADMCLFAALSGMRIGEIAELRVGDVLDSGVVQVRSGKTSAALRQVPIHPALRTMLAARMKLGNQKKPADAYVFHELPEQTSAARGRGAPVTQAFTRHRRALGVDDTPAGNRRSRVDFHSWRRWFIRKAVDALEAGATGFTPWIIAEVVGHSTEEGALPMTMGTYPGPASVAARRACVEAVRLPGKTALSVAG